MVKFDFHSLTPCSYAQFAPGMQTWPCEFAPGWTFKVLLCLLGQTRCGKKIMNGVCAVWEGSAGGITSACSKNEMVANIVLFMFHNSS